MAQHLRRPYLDRGEGKWCCNLQPLRLHGLGRADPHERLRPGRSMVRRLPETVVAVDGAQAEALIPRIRNVIENYRFRAYGDYSPWPGPNSNTFVQAALDSVPELRAVLPPTAIGKDFPYNGRWLGITSVVETAKREVHRRTHSAGHDALERLGVRARATDRAEALVSDGKATCPIHRIRSKMYRLP